ncbi:MAG TPA: BTAD domain-containing putative transcriptional regulator [Longimicrobiales bacterium]|nr:BTAD domain-containing putative transcriptional regulator [Longimicrobiales bacterium]
MSKYTLRILGPMRLTGPDGTSVQSVLHQPKRAALLAVLAVAPFGSRTRSELRELFWANSTEEDGRHALSQALYYLRRSLGQSAIDVEGDVVRLNADVIATDVAAFRDHLAQSRLEEAVALYGGDLLEQAPSIPGFDQWLDGAREKLRQQALDALSRLSAGAEAAGDHEAAIHWAERGHALSPWHEAPLRRLLASLIAASQPVRARETFDRFATMLREEMDTEPTPETAAILESAPPAPTRPALPVPTQSVSPAPAWLAEPAPGQLHEPGEHPPAVLPTAPAPRRWIRRALLPAAALTLMLAGAFVDRLWTFDSRREAAAAPSATRVGIFPFLYRGHPELAYLGEGIPELIGISIQSLDQISMLDPRALASGSDGKGTEELRAVDAAQRARALGAAHFVVGSVVEAGGQIHVTAQLHRSDGNLVAVVSDRAAGEAELFDLIDDLVRQLLGSAFPGTTQLERSAAHATRSLPALRHFLRGERLFRSGHYQDAVAAFDNAALEDSAFALAHYRSAIALLWSDNADFDRARVKTASALAHRERVSALDRDLFLALDEFLRGRLFTAERLYESVLARQPENIEAWFQLAETRFHYGGLHGRSISESDNAWRHVVALNPEHHAALIHLSALAARRCGACLDSLEAKVNGPGDAVVATPQIRALRVFATGSESDRARFIAELSRFSGHAVASSAAYAARYLADPSAGVRIASVLTDAARSNTERAQGHLLLAHFALARGQIAMARQQLARARELDAAQAEPHRLFVATIPPVAIELRHGGDTAGRATLRLNLPHGASGLSRFDGLVASGMHVYGRALSYYVGGGEDGALVSAARQLNEPPNEPGHAPLLQSLARGLVAERYLSHGDSAAARAELERAITGVERWYEHLRADYLRSLARERFLLAELEIAAGRDDVAESLLEPLGENSVAELPYLGASLIRIGEIRERAGDAQGAAAAYGRVQQLWSQADPALDPIRDEISARISNLARATEPVRTTTPARAALRP